MKHILLAVLLGLGLSACADNANNRHYRCNDDNSNNSEGYEQQQSKWETKDYCVGRRTETVNTVDN